MKLSEIVKNYRKEHHLSMDEMAKRCNTSKPYISMLENDKNTKTGRPIIPKADTLMKLAFGMNMELEQLIKMMDGDIVIQISPNKRVDSVLSQKEQTLLSRYRMLDDEDKGEVSGFINGLLRNKKYTEKESHLA